MKPIYINHQHEAIIQSYLDTIFDNFSTMVSGFFCGYENKTNANSVRIHRHLLSEFGIHVCKDLKKLKPIDGSN